MAEVKSTLELVMERTRHMTMTDEEKREQSLEEYKRGLRGLLQKVKDGALRPERFKAELKGLQESSGLSDKTVVIEELADHLELDEDNTWALDLLREAFATRTEELTAVLHDYRQTLESLTHRRIGELLKNLLEDHGIHGSAVIPNLAVDSEWAAGKEQLRERFKPALQQAAAGLKATAGF